MLVRTVAWLSFVVFCNDTNRFFCSSAGVASPNQVMGLVWAYAANALNPLSVRCIQIRLLPWRGELS